MSVRLAKVNLSAKDNGITHMCYAVMSFYRYVSQKHIFKNMKSLLANDISKTDKLLFIWILFWQSLQSHRVRPSEEHAPRHRNAPANF